MLGCVDLPEFSVLRVKVLINDRYKLFAMFGELGSNVEYNFLVGYDVRFIGLINGFMTEGRFFKCSLLSLHRHCQDNFFSFIFVRIDDKVMNNRCCGRRETYISVLWKVLGLI